MPLVWGLCLEALTQNVYFYPVQLYVQPALNLCTLPDLNSFCASLREHGIPPPAPRGHHIGVTSFVTTCRP